MLTHRASTRLTDPFLLKLQRSLRANMLSTLAAAVGREVLKCVKGKFFIESSKLALKTFIPVT
jgi:hypothetical protein